MSSGRSHPDRWTAIAPADEAVLDLEEEALRLRTRELVDSEGRGATPFGTYLLSGSDPRREIARAVEAKVFFEAFGNSPAVVEQEYGFYDPTSVFGCIVDHRRMLPVATVRLIVSDALGLKFFDDFEKLYGVPFEEIAARNDLAIDPTRCWEIATLAVRKEYRYGLLSLALFQVIGTLSALALQGWLVSNIEVPVIRTVQMRLGSPFGYFEGTHPAPYLGSPACVPIWTTVARIAEKVGAKDPMLRDLLLLGEGLEHAIGPPDWPTFALVGMGSGEKLG